MREFFREIVHALEEGRPVELVSIAASDGSTPRGAGAMMAVFPAAAAPAPWAAATWSSSASAWRRSCWSGGGDALRQFRFTPGRRRQPGHGLRRGE